MVNKVRAVRKATTIATLSRGLVTEKKAAPSIDIEKEYELIQQKKSKLPRAKRDWVVSQMNLS